jgi:hypothetical protein
MSITKSIEQARQRGASDDTIIAEIYKQNPNKASSIEQAINRGAKSSAIIDEIIKQSSSTQTEQPVEEKKQTTLGKIGRVFTGATQKFAETLGTAASVIDPVTRRTGRETLQSAQEQADEYLQMAQKTEDKEQKTALLEAAQELADTENIDIYNRPEYQKTAKQVYGEAIGTAAETLGWGKVGNLVKGIKGATVGQSALRGAVSGGALGGIFGASSAMEEDKTGREIGRSALGGAVSGAALGGAGGAIAGRIAGSPSMKRLQSSLIGKPTSTKKAQLYRSGQLKEASFLKNEKYLPNEKDIQLGKLAKDIGIKGKSNFKDISRVNTAISDEASKLKTVLKESGAIYNKNNIKGVLNKMKADKTVDLIPAEERVYDKMIGKFNKMVDTRKGRKLDDLLELRQEYDKWAKSNNPNIFENRTGGSYRALTSVRDTINNYINTKIKNDVVKQSLNKQHNLFTILDNVAEASSSKTGLTRAGYIKPAKQLLKWSALVGGAYLLRQRGGGGGMNFAD